MSASESIILTDVDQSIWHENYRLDQDSGPQLAGSSQWSLEKRTLHGGVSDGVDVIEVNNGKLSFSILPTRGMGLWKGTCEGLHVGWNSPVKSPVHPAFVQQEDRGGLGWLGGFNEWMVRCGLSWHGAPCHDPDGHPLERQLTLHGRIANTPAHYVEASVSPENGGEISVTGVVRETIFFGPHLELRSTVKTRAGSSSLTIIDEVTNHGNAAADLELLYHTNLGSPILEEGARFVAPIREMVPRDKHAADDNDTYGTYLGPTDGYVEQCYFFDMLADEHGKTPVLLRNRSGNIGFSMSYNRETLPWFTLWKCTHGNNAGYVTGLEPGTDFPNPRPFERQKGRVIKLGVGQTHRTELELAIHTTAAEVKSIEQHIAQLQNRVHPVVHKEPHGDWCPS
ncbi:MAG: aldose 1-epimerase family protein [Planctomycetaceae bacterium]